MGGKRCVEVPTAKGGTKKASTGFEAASTMVRVVDGLHEDRFMIVFYNCSRSISYESSSQ